MSKFHINKNGVPAACHAKEGNCPLGGNSGSERHFNSLEDAQAFVKQENEDNYGLLPGIQEEVTRFTKPNPDNIKNAIEKRFPGEDYTHEVFVEHYNVEETDDGKYKLTSIPMHAEVYFEDEEKDAEVVEFEYENTKDITFDSEEEVEEYVDRIHLKLNGDEEDEEEAKWNAILNNDEYKVDPKVAEDSIRERVENAKSRMELDLKLAKELREEQ